MTPKIALNGTSVLEHSTPFMGVMSSNPGTYTWSRRPNTCEERGLSGSGQGLEKKAHKRDT